MGSRECQVCLESYDEGERKPRCLSCGHTLCTACLSDCLNAAPLLCPFCRLPHASPVTSPTDVPVNYAVISLLQDAAAPARKRSEALLAEVKKEASEVITAQTVTCNCNLARLHELEQRLSEQANLHRMHMQALTTLLGRHEAVLQDMKEAADNVTSLVTEGKQVKINLEAAQARLAGATTLLQVTAAHEQDQRYGDTVTEWDAAAHRLLQSPIVAKARELEFVSSAALQAVVERSMTAAAAAAVATSPASKTHLQTPLYQLEGETCTTPPREAEGASKLVVEVLRQAGMVGSTVWATEDRAGRPRCARLVQRGQRLFLSALQEGSPPLYAHTLQYQQVRTLVEESCPRVFLEVSWGGQVRGHSIVRLTNAATRTRHFFYLCSGEMGPSYAKSRLLEVESRGQPGERVWGGDYQANDGSGGAALQGFTMGDMTTLSVTAGLVAAFCYGSDEHRKPAHFVVYNNDYPVAYEECPVGKVEEGLELFRSAAKLTDIRDAAITDCGLVLTI